MTTEHKYAHVLRWIADGEEVQRFVTVAWLGYTAEKLLAMIAVGEHEPLAHFRIKPRAVMCNGVEVPAPESVAPAKGARFYTPDVAALGGAIARTWFGGNDDMVLLEKGIVYLNRDDTVARARAMLVVSEC